MLIFALGQKFGAKSRTEVLERHKVGVIQAAKQFIRAADNFCRGSSIKKKHIHEAKALELIEDIMPPPPLGRPEDMLENPFTGNLDDSIGGLITHISKVIQKIAKGELNGLQLVLEMETIERDVEGACAFSGWDYIGGAPLDALQNIKSISESLRRIGLSMGKTSILSSSITLPKNRRWGLGKGISKAIKNVDFVWQSKWKKKKIDIEDKYDVSAFAYPAPDTCGVIWPDFETCLIVSCNSLYDYLMWLEKYMEEMRLLSGSVHSLTITPKIRDKIIPQLAMRLFSFTALPDEGFELTWRNRLENYKWHISDTIKHLRLAQESMISLYSTQFHLKGRELLEPEMGYLNKWKKMAEDSFTKLQKPVDDNADVSATIAVEYLNDFHNMLLESNDKNGSNSGAVAYALSLQKNLLEGSENEQINNSALIVLEVLEAELLQFEDRQ